MSRHLLDPTVGRRALELMAEQLLLRDGATSKGVKRHVPKLVQDYLRRAYGVKPLPYGSVFKNLRGESAPTVEFHKKEHAPVEAPSKGTVLAAEVRAKPLKRAFGNTLLGYWYNPITEETLYPNQLRKRQEEFDWLPHANARKGYLWPHASGSERLAETPLGESPLEYHEAERQSLRKKALAKTPLKRAFGNAIVGEWNHPVLGYSLYPNQLRKLQEEFDWLPHSNAKSGYLWPHAGGVALVYSEAE